MMMMMGANTGGVPALDISGLPEDDEDDFEVVEDDDDGGDGEDTLDEHIETLYEEYSHKQGEKEATTALSRPESSLGSRPTSSLGSRPDSSRSSRPHSGRRKSEDLPEWLTQQQAHPRGGPLLVAPSSTLMAADPVDVAEVFGLGLAPRQEYQGSATSSLLGGGRQVYVPPPPRQESTKGGPPSRALSAKDRFLDSLQSFSQASLSPQSGANAHTSPAGKGRRKATPAHGAVRSPATPPRPQPPKKSTPRSGARPAWNYASPRSVGADSNTPSPVLNALRPKSAHQGEQERVVGSSSRSTFLKMRDVVERSAGSGMYRPETARPFQTTGHQSAKKASQRLRRVQSARKRENKQFMDELTRTQGQRLDLFRRKVDEANEMQKTWKRRVKYEVVEERFWETGELKVRCSQGDVSREIPMLAFDREYMTLKSRERKKELNAKREKSQFLLRNTRAVYAPSALRSETKDHLRGVLLDTIQLASRLRDQVQALERKGGGFSPFV